MGQTAILLDYARKDYSQALNVLLLVHSKTISCTIEDVMTAFHIAKLWCAWIKNPEMKDNPIKDRKADFSSMLEMFEHYVEVLGQELLESEFEVSLVFKRLNPNLYLTVAGDNVQVTNFMRYAGALRATAEFFEKECGDPMLMYTFKEKMPESVH